MSECVNAVDSPGETLCGDACDPLRRATDAANGAKDPDFIARADASARASQPEESSRLAEATSGCGSGRAKAVVLAAGEIRRHVVGMDMVARVDRSESATDRRTVFEHWRASLQVAHGELVASWNGT